MPTTGFRARRRPVIAALCFAIGSAAGGGGFDVATARTPDPCAVLPASQLRSWFGKEVLSKPTRGGPPTHRFGYRALPGIGEKAYIVPVQGGWEAGAVKGNKSVWARSPNLSNTIAPALLKTTVAKL